MDADSGTVTVTLVPAETRCPVNGGGYAPVRRIVTDLDPQRAADALGAALGVEFAGWVAVGRPARDGGRSLHCRREKPVRILCMANHDPAARSPICRDMVNQTETRASYLDATQADGDLMTTILLIALAPLAALAGCLAYIIVSLKLNAPVLASRVGRRQFMLFHARRMPRPPRRAFAHTMAPRLRPVYIRSR